MLSSTTRIFAVGVSLILAPLACQGFLQPVVPPSIKSGALFSTIEPQGKGRGGRSVNDGNESDDLENTRAALEELMTMHGPRGDETQALHIMTSAGRRRRQLEMDLLRQLYYDPSLFNTREHDLSDGQPQEASKAVDELMHLWMYEHDVESALQLEAMQETCSPGMVVEEAQLRRMAEEFPTWAEPRARLAILLFMKGISAEAYDMALEALKLKPWHFEVYPVLIMICLRHEDIGQALYWARQALPVHRPTEGNSRRRKAWVDRALDLAAQQWEDAERETQEQQQTCSGSLASDLESGDMWQ